MDDAGLVIRGASIKKSIEEGKKKSRLSRLIPRPRPGGTGAEIKVSTKLANDGLEGV
jgi:hypothetical protein